MKKRIISSIALLILSIGLLWSNNIFNTSNTPLYLNGDYFYTSDVESNGYFVQARIVIENGQITIVELDAASADGTLKSNLSKSGEYVMTENGPLLHEQYQNIAQYIVKTQGTSGLNLDEQGKTDVITSASISVSPYINAVNEILNLASVSSCETVIIKSSEPSNGYYPQATITHSNGVIHQIVFDSITDEGVSKVTQSKMGEYVMTENGPLLHEQLYDLAAYIISNQDTQSLNLNENGKTDVVSSASISVSPYVLLVDEFLGK